MTLADSTTEMPVRERVAELGQRVLDGGEISRDEAIELARQYRPAAITLDLRLPDSDGWVVLDRLKHDTTTKHIPVHVISAFSEPARAVEVGAFASLEKPVSRKALDDAFDQIHSFLQRSIRRVLLVEDDVGTTSQNSIAWGGGLRRASQLPPRASEPRNQSGFRG